MTTTDDTTAQDEPACYLFSVGDYQALETIAHRLGQGMKVSTEQRRDLSKLMRTLLNRAKKV